MSCRHVVDSQSFPLVVPGFAELAAKGAYSSSMTYSASDVAGIVAYAAAVSTINLTPHLETSQPCP